MIEISLIQNKQTMKINYKVNVVLLIIITIVFRLNAHAQMLPKKQDVSGIKNNNPDNYNFLTHAQQKPSPFLGETGAPST